MTSRACDKCPFLQLSFPTPRQISTRHPHLTANEKRRERANRAWKWMIPVRHQWPSGVCDRCRQEGVEWSRRGLKSHEGTDSGQERAEWLKVARKACKCFAIYFHHSYCWPCNAILAILCHFIPFNAIFAILCQFLPLGMTNILCRQKTYPVWEVHNSYTVSAVWFRTTDIFWFNADTPCLDWWKQMVNK